MKEQKTHYQTVDLSIEAQAAMPIPSRRWYSFFKRIFDIFFSLFGLIIFSPIFLILTIIIFIDDPHGSPFYVQLRVGKGGRKFKFYKFRSMVIGAEQMLDKLQHKNEVVGPAFKLKEDPRITRIGKFIRKTSIDELPQLFNVLKGDMSIVGPRPPLPNEVLMYTEDQKVRFSITPGLTCYWQIQPKRNSLSFDEWLLLDIKYIRERNFLLDLRIIICTVGAVLRMDGL